MDRLTRPRQSILTAALCLGAGCSFDTAPLHATGAAALSEAGAGVAGSAGHGAAIVPSARVISDAAGAGGSLVMGASVGAGTASRAGAAGAPSASPTAPPATPAGAASAAPTHAPTTCDAVGSYGLRINADLAWDATNGFADAGRGPTQVVALLEVSRVDPQSGTVSAEAQLCGLALPALSSPFSCQFELRFADKLWERRELPRARLGGAYTCAADGCKLELAPELTLGIQLDPMQPAWPAPGTTPVSQYPDDDGDGLPGLSADIITLDSSQSGPGNANANGNPGCSYTPFGAAAGLASVGTGGNENGRMLLGVRAQLAAAVSLAQDCRVTGARGDLQSLGLRAGGCELRTASWTGQGAMGAMPGSANDKTPCSEELRNAIDQGLPSFQVLAAGQAPPPTSTSVRDMSLSQGPQLRAVRFLPGVKPSCDQVRKAMY